MIRCKRKNLNSDIKKILKSESNIYGQALSVEKYIKESKIEDCNTFLLMSALEWDCGRATQFPEDIISFGNSALYWLKKAINIEPDNDGLTEGFQSLEKKIQKAIKKMERKKERQYCRC